MNYFTVDFGVNYANVKKHNDKKIEKILETSWNEGVGKIVCISNSVRETKRNLELGSKEYTNNNFHFTVGIHPHNAKSYREGDMEIIRKGIENPKCFGIGECGLDYNRMFSPRDLQIKVFREHVKLAKETNSKLYLHCRNSNDDTKASQDFNKIINEFGHYRGLIHVFYGTLEQALQFTKSGFKLGITGILLDKRRNKDLIKVIKSSKITLDMLVVETDAPFLAIYPEKVSEPGHTGYIVEEIARLKNMDVVKCGNILYENSLKWLEK